MDIEEPLFYLPQTPKALSSNPINFMLLRWSFHQFLPTFFISNCLNMTVISLVSLSLTSLSLIHLPSNCQNIADAFIALSNSSPQPTSDFSATCLRKGTWWPRGQPSTNQSVYKHSGSYPLEGQFWHTYYMTTEGAKDSAPVVHNGHQLSSLSPFPLLHYYSLGSSPE